MISILSGELLLSHSCATAKFGDYIKSVITRCKKLWFDDAEHCLLPTENVSHYKTDVSNTAGTMGKNSGLQEPFNVNYVSPNFKYRPSNRNIFFVNIFSEQLTTCYSRNLVCVNSLWAGIAQSV